MKRMTRRQVAGWLLPIRSALKEMLSGEVDSIRGYAVTRLHRGDEYERVSAKAWLKDGQTVAAYVYQLRS